MEDNTNRSCVLIATGDLMFHGEIYDRINSSGDMLWPFGPVKDMLAEGDVLFGNFETPVTTHIRDNKKPQTKYYSPLGIGRGLKEIGYDVVNLAHNHICDFGDEGILTTINELNIFGLKYIGIGRNADEALRPVIVSCQNGMTLGFIGYATSQNAVDNDYSYKACFPDLNRVAKDIAALKQKVDFVIISCHTGAQYNPYPEPDTRKLAHIAIENGAMVFLGHHPHVPQGYEKIGHGMAVYSLGDFISPTKKEMRRETFFAKLTLCPQKDVNLEIVPCYINDEFQTIPAPDQLKDKIVNHIESLSRDISEGRSDALHYQTVNKRFLTQYFPAWKEEYQEQGFKIFIQKIKHIRYYHIKIIMNLVFSQILKIKQIFKRKK
jgi:poly-gamma-glutamate synthesis protein (capsule biosynthesis protein)